MSTAVTLSNNCSSSLLRSSQQMNRSCAIDFTPLKWRLSQHWTTFVRTLHLSLLTCPFVRLGAIFARRTELWYCAEYSLLNATTLGMLLNENSRVTPAMRLAALRVLHACIPRTSCVQFARSSQSATAELKRLHNLKKQLEHVPPVDSKSGDSKSGEMMDCKDDSSENSEDDMALLAAVLDSEHEEAAKRHYEWASAYRTKVAPILQSLDQPLCRLFKFWSLQHSATSSFMLLHFDLQG